MKLPVLLFATILLAFTSCNTMKKNVNDTAANQEISERYWQLVEINGKPIAQDFEKEPFIQLNSAEKRVNATGGCNSIFGGFDLNEQKGELKFSQLASTQMACPNESLDQELSIALDKTTHFTIEGSTMWLEDINNKKLAKFKMVANHILNGEWELTHYSSTQKNFVALFPETKPSLNFQLLEQRVSGNGSCNTFNSSFEIEGNKITFGPIVSTRMACKGEGESEFFKTLAEINRFHVDNKSLTLFKGDLLMMKFKRKP